MCRTTHGGKSKPLVQLLRKMLTGSPFKYNWQLSCADLVVTCCTVCVCPSRMLAASGRHGNRAPASSPTRRSCSTQACQCQALITAHTQRKLSCCWRACRLFPGFEAVVDFVLGICCLLQHSRQASCVFCISSCVVVCATARVGHSSRPSCAAGLLLRVRFWRVFGSVLGCVARPPWPSLSEAVVVMLALGTVRPSAGLSLLPGCHCCMKAACAGVYTTALRRDAQHVPFGSCIATPALFLACFCSWECRGKVITHTS